MRTITTLSIRFCFLALLLVSARTSAQVPGGSILWLRADRGVVVQNGHIARWQDQSGRGNDAVMADTSKQPDLITSTQNGKPAILFRGANYLDCPPIFPTRHDYTICMVAKIDDGSTNNLLSGHVYPGHTLWAYWDADPRITHADPRHVTTSPIRIWPSAFYCVTASYREFDQQAALYVSGAFADSSFIGPTTDSTISLGSCAENFFLKGEIQEVLLYDRVLGKSERDSVDTYFMAKYVIARAEPIPKPDSTFSVLPHNLQLYPRGADDSATVPIAGTIYRTGFDSVSVVEFKNGQVIATLAQTLQYADGKASFSLTPRIHAELSEYRFDVHLTRGHLDSIIASRDSIVCGEVLMVDGQGNSSPGFISYRYTNEFCRSFGVKYSTDPRDTLWEISWPDGGSVGAWALRFQQDLVEREHLPSCCINGAVGGTNIEEHEPNDTDKYNLWSIYGEQFYKATKAGVRMHARVRIWDQGEANYAPGYYQKFLRLYGSWKEDYPALQKIYLIQLRPNGCYFGNIDMRDVQRAMGDSLKDVEPIAAAAIPGQDGCHYSDSGCIARGDRFFASVSRDFYGSTDTADLRSPNAIFAYYTNANHNQIAILFSPRGVSLHKTNDTVVNGFLGKLEDNLYTDDISVRVQSVSFDLDTMFVDLDKTTNATTIAYLHDQHYAGSDTVIYEGPWIVNSRGYGALLWYHLPIHWWPLAVRPDAPNASLAVYPNPTAHSVQIDWPQATGALHAHIINELGAVVWSQSMGFSGSTVTLDFGPLPAGAYVLELTSGSLRERRKILIEP